MGPSARASELTSALVGFVFRIGVPAAYAEKAGISRFPVALPKFGFDGWAQFYELAVKRQEVVS